MIVGTDWWWQMHRRNGAAVVLRSVALLIICVAPLAVAASLAAHPPSPWYLWAALPLAMAAISSTIVWRRGADRRRERMYLPPSNLPATATNIVGRDRLYGKLREHLLKFPGRRLTLVSGAPGIGKTTVALYTAHRVASEFGGGELYARFDPDIDLDSGIRTVRRAFITALSQPNARVPRTPLGETFRYWWLTRRRRWDRQLLVVLDEVISAAQVRALQPRSRWSATIVTSREPLQLARATQRLVVRALDHEAAMQMLSGILGETRVQQERSDADRIVAAAAYHPLAIRLVGMALANRPYLDLTLARDRMLSGDEQTRDNFVAALDLSYSMLTKSEQRALIALGLITRRRFTAWELGALLGRDEREAWRYCDRLTDSGLLERRSADKTGVQYFRLLEHVESYVKDRVQTLWTEEERAQASQGLQEQRLHRREPSTRTYDVEEVFKNYEQGTPSRAVKDARDAVARAREMKDAANEARATVMLAELHAELGGYEDVLDLLDLPIRSLSRPARAQALRLRAKLHRRFRQLGDAHDALTEALGLCGETAERVRVLQEMAIVESLGSEPSRGLSAIDQATLVPAYEPRHRAGLAYAKGRVLLALDRPAEAETTLAAGASTATQLGQRLWQAWIAYQRAITALARADHAAAVDHAGTGLEHFGAMRHRYGNAHCRMAMGYAAQEQDDADRALIFFEEALETFRYCSDVWVEAEAAERLADVSHDRETAAGLLKEAEALFRSIKAHERAEQAYRKYAAACSGLATGGWLGEGR